MPRSESLLLSYGTAVLLTFVASVGRWLLDPWLGDSQEFSLQFGVVAIAVWRGGAGPGTLATVLGYFVCDYLFMQPRGDVGLIDVREGVNFATYLISCATIITFGEGMRRANRRAQQFAATLQQAEARKDEFLATLAHELRNRIAPIANAIEVLRIKLPSWTMTEIISRQVRHMTRLVDDLFDISRIAAGQITLSREHVALASVLEDAVDASRPHIDAARQTLHVHLPPQTIRLYADTTRLSQVFSNLVNNASRYTPPSGVIELSVSTDAQSAVVSVRDNGIGIPPEMLPRIFDMFMRLDRSAERKSAGLGIGLTLARRLLELHGATIEVSSGGAGQGSEFRVRLPLAQAQPAKESSDCDRPLQARDCDKSRPLESILVE